MKEQHSSHIRKIGACLHQILNLRERELIVDSGASMHMISKKKDLSDADMDTLTKSLQSYDSHNRQWRSAGRMKEANGVCQRILENDASSIVAWKALR